MDFHRFPVDEQYCEVKFESFGFTNKQVCYLVDSYIFCSQRGLQITMKWMDQAQSNVNKNISLAQFSFTVSLMDSYSTDYYDIAYPGLIMKVRKMILLASEHGAYMVNIVVSYFSFI